MRALLLFLSALTMVSCSAMLQGSQGNSGSANTAQTGSDTSGKVTSTRGYQPTNDDVVRYNNDITAFLKANVPNLDLNSKTLIMINDEKASSLKGVELKYVKLISVLDASNASILGSSTYKGAIIIKTK